MSDPRVTDEAVEAAAATLSPAHFEPFEYVDPEPMREHFREQARAALEAAWPHLAPQPLCTCPTEADVTPDMRTETGQHLSGCPTLGGPTREQIAEALHAHDQKRALVPRTWAKASELTKHDYLRYADAVLSLLNGSQANG